MLNSEELFLLRLQEKLHKTKLQLKTVQEWGESQVIGFKYNYICGGCKKYIVVDKPANHLVEYPDMDKVLCMGTQVYVLYCPCGNINVANTIKGVNGCLSSLIGLQKQGNDE